MTKQTNTSHAFFLVVKDGALKLADNQEGDYKRYWKMLAGYGEFVDPNGRSQPMVLDKAWAQELVDNFKNGPIQEVPVPFGHPKNSTDLALFNRGWLVDAEARDDGLYGLLEIRDDEAATMVEKGLVNQTSVAFDDMYQDKKSGKWYHNVLRHVGMVVDPYIKGMTEFQPALAEMAGASMLFSDSNNSNQREENTMSKITNNRDFQVTVKFKDGETDREVVVAPGIEVEVPETVVDEVTKQIADATAPVVEETAEEKAAREKREADEAAAAAKAEQDKAAELEKREAELADKEANLTYNQLLSEGKIIPAQKDAFIALSKQGSTTVELSDGNKKTVSTLLAELFEKGRKVVALNDEKGAGAGGQGGAGENIELTDEEKSLGADFGNTPEELAAFKKSQQ